MADILQTVINIGYSKNKLLPMANHTFIFC